MTAASSKLLGVDFGVKRVGLAITDQERKLALPLEVYQRQTQDADAEHFRTIVRQHRVGGIVVGLPVHMSGDIGGKAKQAEAFGRWLADVTGLPVAYWDERFTTADADQLLRQAGLTEKKRRQRRDMIAAQLMLQSYIDAGCPEDRGTHPID